jgi:hypothetical protein
MNDKRKLYWKTIFGIYNKKTRLQMKGKRHQLCYWLGHLVIEYNSLENSLSFKLMEQLVDLLAPNEPPPQDLKPAIGNIPPALRRAWDSNLKENISAAMSYRQKLDFLAALLYKQYAGNENHLTHIKAICALMYDADEYRNKMVHSYWYDGIGDFTRYKPSSKGMKGLRITKHRFDFQQISEAVRAMKLVDAIFCTCLTDPAFADETNKRISFDQLKKMLNPPAPVPPVWGLASDE